MKTLVGTFNQEKAIVGTFFVIVRSSRTLVRSSCVAVYSYSSAPHLGPSSDQHAAANITARVSSSSSSSQHQHQPALTSSYKNVIQTQQQLTCCYSAAVSQGNCVLTTGARVSEVNTKYIFYTIINIYTK